MISGRYDAGQATVPGGIVGPVQRVIVVGAGIAGLTVANALRHAGVDCVVLEARDRIGGRLHTIDLGGWPVDMGGSWIHHPIGNPMAAFADQVGVGRQAADPQPEIAAYDAAEGRRLTRAEVEAELQMLYEEFPAEVERLRAELPADASMADAVNAFVAASGRRGAVERRTRQGLRAVLEGESAGRADRLSMRWMWNEVEFDGGFFGDVPVGGYRRIVAAMADDLDVRVGVPVSEIVVSADGVTVRGTDGFVETGSHVVVTVPLGVLQRGGIRFEPELPPDRVATVHRLGFGRLEKVVMAFDWPFWRAAGLPHAMLFPRDPDQPTTWVFGHDGFGGGPVLVAFVFQSTTDRVLDCSDGEAAGWVLDALGEAMGAASPAPVAVARTGWATDPYAGGAYTHIPPDATPADADALGEPVAGRLLFAGEHTQSARLAYADGALASGVREAKRLLQRSSVELGRLR